MNIIESKVERVIEQISKSTKEADVLRRGFYKKYPYSVSNIVSHLKTPFDKDKIANKTHDLHFDDPKSIYYKKSVEEIIEMWDKKAETGRANGVALDDFIGLILDDNASDDVLDDYKSGFSETIQKKCDSYYKFYNSSIKDKLTFLCREQVLVHPDLKVNGRFDAMFYYNSNILLMDWKNTEKIANSNKFSKMLGPLYSYDDCELNSYTMQVYIYKYILRNVYHLYDVNIVPLIVQVGQKDVKTYQPIIEYSDKLVEDCIDYAVSQIDRERAEMNK